MLERAGAPRAGYRARVGISAQATALNSRFGPLRNCVVQPMCVEEPAHMVNQPATVNDERHHYR
jgi:hypothetical protein